MNTKTSINDLKIDDALIVSVSPINLGWGIPVFFAGVSKNGKVLAFKRSLKSKDTTEVVEWDFWEKNENNERKVV